LTPPRKGIQSKGPMAPLHREVPPPEDPPTQVCVRCSKPITRVTAAQIAGRPVHMRCLARATQLDSIEQQDRAQLEVMRAKAAQARAAELIDKIRQLQTICPACGERLGTSRGVLFQGDWLVHAACWRDDPKPFDGPPPAG
jgi:hypothetical protein